MAFKLFGLIVAFYSLVMVIRQLQLGVTITRQFRTGVSRAEHPVEFWVTITIEVIFGIIGAMMLCFGPLGKR